MIYWFFFLDKIIKFICTTELELVPLSMQSPTFLLTYQKQERMVAVPGTQKEEVPQDGNTGDVCRSKSVGSRLLWGPACWKSLCGWYVTSMAGSVDLCSLCRTKWNSHGKGKWWPGPLWRLTRIHLCKMVPNHTKSGASRSNVTSLWSLSRLPVSLHWQYVRVLVYFVLIFNNGSRRFEIPLHDPSLPNLDGCQVNHDGNLYGRSP